MPKLLFAVYQSDTDERKLGIQADGPMLDILSGISRYIYVESKAHDLPIEEIYEQIKSMVEWYKHGEE